MIMMMMMQDPDGVDVDDHHSQYDGDAVALFER